MDGYFVYCNVTIGIDLREIFFFQEGIYFHIIIFILISIILIMENRLVFDKSIDRNEETDVSFL